MTGEQRERGTCRTTEPRLATDERNGDTDNAGNGSRRESEETAKPGGMDGTPSAGYTIMVLREALQAVAEMVDQGAEGPNTAEAWNPNVLARFQEAMGVAEAYGETEETRQST